LEIYAAAARFLRVKNVRATCYDVLRRRKFLQIKNFLDIFLYQDQTASAVCH